MARSLPISYSPNPTPYDNVDIPRYLEQELYRISEALIAQPVAFSISGSGSLTITTTPNWQRIFTAATPSWDIPGGGWDDTLNQWTVPQNGLYQLTTTLRVDAFGLGNKTYYAGLRIVVVNADGSPDTILETTDGGDDDVPLGVTLTGQIPLYQGDVLYYEATVVHENQTGTVNAYASAQTLRVSA